MDAADYTRCGATATQSLPWKPGCQMSPVMGEF